MTGLSWVRRAAWAAGLVGATLFATACGGSPEVVGSVSTPDAGASGAKSDSPRTVAPTPEVPEPVALAVVGDSNSTGFSGTIDAGRAAGTAWVALLPPEKFTYVGGWAVDGATTTNMADAATVVPGVELLVIMGGTNDLARGIPIETTLSELQRVAANVEAPSVAIAAIAPYDYSPDAALALNTAYEKLARDNGWIFVDPWITTRTADGVWIVDYVTDGVHTNAAGYAQAAKQIADQLATAAR